MSADKNEIETRIRRAFGCNSSLDAPLPYEFSEMNHKISRYDTTTVKKFLPLLMIKEMEQKRDIAFSTGDHLVYFLDGYLLGGRNEAGEKSQVEFKQKQFTDFSREEGEAILEWLQKIAYPKYQDLCSNDLDSAITFWRDKISHK